MDSIQSTFGFSGKIHERHRFKHLSLKENELRYEDNPEDLVGCYIHRFPLTVENNYFKIKILNTGLIGAIAIGVAPYHYPLSSQPGWTQGSTAYHADDGKLYRDNGIGIPLGPSCKKDDIMGCGIRRTENARVQAAVDSMRPLRFFPIEVFFTKNGKEVGKTTTIISSPSGDLYPAVGLHSAGECVELIMNQPHSFPFGPPGTLDHMMHIDRTEDQDWSRTHDLFINGQILEYAGKGRSVRDVAMAQARKCLNTTTHYFEVEILEPGQHCYIAIGLVHKNYPKHRHPGWNAGSVAYHADDGQIFVGKGQGVPFGPRCYKGDIMGCGIWFPPDDEIIQDTDAVGIEKSERKAKDPDVVQKSAGNSEEDENASSPDEDEHVEVTGRDLEDDGFLWLPRPGQRGENIDERQSRRPDVGHIWRHPARHYEGERAWKNIRQLRRLRTALHDDEAAIYGEDDKRTTARVFFTRNGQCIGETSVPMPKQGFYPAVGMLSTNEKVKVDLAPLTG